MVTVGVKALQGEMETTTLGSGTHPVDDFNDLSNGAEGNVVAMEVPAGWRVEIRNPASEGDGLTTVETITGPGGFGLDDNLSDLGFQKQLTEELVVTEQESGLSAIGSDEARKNLKRAASLLAAFVAFVLLVR